MSDVVFPEELVYFVESIRPFQLHEVGQDRWLDCHEMIIKLSQQAILEAASHREETVKEFLVLHDKLKVLVHEAYCILLWKTKVLPHLLEIDPNPQATFLIYTVLFHEGSVISLLEIALFHENGCESLKEASVDLVDYCAQAVAQLIGLVNMGYHENESNIDVDEAFLTEIERQKRDMLFKIGLRCTSILNYLVDHLDAVPCSASRRMVTTHDIPWLMADLLSFRPWSRKTSKGTQQYIDDKWTTVSGDDLAKVVRYEAQAWFCLRQILFNNSLMEIYDMNESRRTRLAQCQGLLHDTIIDQLPPLVDLKQFLSSLPINSNQQSKPKKNLVLEELPEIREKLITESERNGGYFEIAQRQSDTFLTSSKDKICSLAQRLNLAYNTDLLADMEETASTSAAKNDEKRCQICKKLAEKKCSQCKRISYCSRQCQLEDWPKHKINCSNPSKAKQLKDTAL